MNRPLPWRHTPTHLVILRGQNMKVKKRAGGNTSPGLGIFLLALELCVVVCGCEVLMQRTQDVPGTPRRAHALA